MTSEEKIMVEKEILERLGEPWKNRKVNELMECGGNFLCPVCSQRQTEKMGFVEIRGFPHAHMVTYICTHCDAEGTIIEKPPESYWWDLMNQAFFEKWNSMKIKLFTGTK